MIQTVVLLFTPARELPVILPAMPRPGQHRMATRPQERSRRKGWQQARSVLAIAASSLGFMLFMAGLGLVLHLAEALLS